MSTAALTPLVNSITVGGILLPSNILENNDNCSVKCNMDHSSITMDNTTQNEECIQDLSKFNSLSINENNNDIDHTNTDRFKVLNPNQSNCIQARKHINNAELVCCDLEALSTELATADKIVINGDIIPHTSNNSAFQILANSFDVDLSTASSLPLTSSIKTSVAVSSSAFPSLSSKSQKLSTNGIASGDNNYRTQELIKKQICEIEKEISRRIQNKNVKKINEAELAQLFSDHGFGNFVGTISNNTKNTIEEAVIPYKPLESNDNVLQHPLLNQLSSSFSPPVDQRTTFPRNSVNPTLNECYDSFGNFSLHQQPFHTAHQISQQQLHVQQNIAQNFSAESFAPVFAQPPASNQIQNFGMTLSGGGMGLHGPSAFLTSPVMPQHHQSIIGFMPQQQSKNLGGFSSPSLCQDQTFVQNSFQLANSSTSSSVNTTNSLNMQQQFTNPISQFYSLPNFQQHFYQAQQQKQLPQNVSLTSTHFSNATPAAVSGITPDMATALIQQIQQENPGLIENLVDQQSNSNKYFTTPQLPTETKNPTEICMIPAPPQSQNSISRSVKFSQSLMTIQSQGNKCSPTKSNLLQNNGCTDLEKQNSLNEATDAEICVENKENGVEPIWVMRDSYLKRLQREEQNRELLSKVASTSIQKNDKSSSETTVDANVEELKETDTLLEEQGFQVDDFLKNKNRKMSTKKSLAASNKKEVMVHEPAVLIEGVLFRARYLGSTQLTTDGRPTKTSRMSQAQEAVSRVKAPDGEIQPSTEIDLFISTEKIMVLNTDLQRISETDVRQDILMDHALRSISYIADISDLVVLMARRVPNNLLNENDDDDINQFGKIGRSSRVVCHVFESGEASFIAQSIGQAFQVAYVEFLRANGIDDPAYLREIDYQEVLNSQELMGEELEMFARKETQKDVVVPKKVAEPLGIVVVESGWGSILPTVVVANMAPGGPASRSNQLNIGDQIIAINGISLVGLPLVTAQQNIKNAKTSTAVRLTIVSTPPVVEVRIKRPDTKYQLGFSVQNGVICSLLRGGIAERGGIRVGHRIIEINHQSVVAVPHEKIVNMLATATGEIHMKTMPTSMFRLLTGQEVPNYI